jgi:hypothetical protein
MLDSPSGQALPQRVERAACSNVCCRRTGPRTSRREGRVYADGEFSSRPARSRAPWRMARHDCRTLSGLPAGKPRNPSGGCGRGVRGILHAQPQAMPNHRDHPTGRSRARSLGPRRRSPHRRAGLPHLPEGRADRPGDRPPGRLAGRSGRISAWLQLHLRARAGRGRPSPAKRRARHDGPPCSSPTSRACPLGVFMGQSW